MTLTGDTTGATTAMMSTTSVSNSLNRKEVSLYIDKLTWYFIVIHIQGSHIRCMGKNIINKTVEINVIMKFHFKTCINEDCYLIDLMNN